MCPSSSSYTTVGRIGFQLFTGIISLPSRLLSHVRKILHGARLPSTSDLFLDSQLAEVSATSVVTNMEPLAACTCTPYSVRLRRKRSLPVTVAHVHHSHCRPIGCGGNGMSISAVRRLHRTTGSEVPLDMFPNT